MTPSTLLRVPTSSLTVQLSTARSLVSRVAYLAPSAWCFIDQELGIISIKIAQIRGVEKAAKKVYKLYSDEEQRLHNKVDGLFLLK